jgi:hypothetical protein
VASFFEQGNEASSFIKREEFLGQLIRYFLSKKSLPVRQILVGNHTEEKSCVYNEITYMTISTPLYVENRIYFLSNNEAMNHVHI